MGLGCCGCEASWGGFLQMKWWYVVVPLEALEVVKNSTVKVIRALQTLSRLCAQVASDIARHRCCFCFRDSRALCPFWGSLPYFLRSG